MNPMISKIAVARSLKVTCWRHSDDVTKSVVSSQHILIISIAKHLNL